MCLRVEFLTLNMRKSSSITFVLFFTLSKKITNIHHKIHVLNCSTWAMDKITENLKRHHVFFDVLAVYAGKYLPWSGSQSFLWMRLFQNKAGYYHPWNYTWWKNVRCNFSVMPNYFGAFFLARETVILKSA